VLQTDTIDEIWKPLKIPIDYSGCIRNSGLSFNPIEIHKQQQFPSFPFTNYHFNIPNYSKANPNFLFNGVIQSRILMKDGIKFCLPNFSMPYQKSNLNEN